MLGVINNFMLDISRVASATCDYQGAGQSSDGYVTTHNNYRINIQQNLNDGA